MTDKLQQMSPEERLYRLRHSAAHVMAEAVLEMFPDAKFGIGPPIDTGFYYDFDAAARRSRRRTCRRSRSRCAQRSAPTCRSSASEIIEGRGAQAVRRTSRTSWS